jgi:fucose 4-O-acetylase-like acetyltransferase
MSQDRDAWLDNARFVLVSLVIFGHAIELVWLWKPWVFTTYKWLYVFHIPALAFVSGAVAKAELSTDTLRGIFHRLLVPLILCQAIAWWLGYLAWWPGPKVNLLFQPWWLLWYLLALAFWRIMLPGFMAMRPAARWVSVLGLALVAGFLTGLRPTSLRILVFFPFFLAGHLWSGRVRALAVHPAGKIAGVAGLAALFALVHHFRAFDVHWVFGSAGNARLEIAGWAAIGARTVHLAAATFGMLAVLLLIPTGTSWLTAHGQRSMGSYIIHGFLLKASIAFGFRDWLHHLSWRYELPVCAAIAFLACWALSLRGTAWLASPVLSPAWARRLLA